MIKNIFFDFDGVILDSVNCKTIAFGKIYEPYGSEIVNKVIDYHLLNGGVSRFEKFNYWHKKHLNVKLDKELMNDLCSKFSKLVVDEVISSPQIPGSFKFISKNYKNYNFWIITGTPTDEIKFITNKLKISKYFKGIYGSPKKKFYWTEYIIKKHRLNREETLFIGDAIADYEAAKMSKIKFILRKADYNIDYFSTIKVLEFSSFNHINKYL
tara:strand:- start:1624 stop:2259 length:636 start_codon:yes stop_codon:yes gene_type:complete